jgi:ABC-2 type transport system permease protein
MGHLLQVAKAFIKRDFQDQTSYRTAALLQLVGGMLSLASLYYLARSIEARTAPGVPGGLLAFWLWGVVLLGLQHAFIAALPQQIRIAQLAGTWEAFLATPAPTWMIVCCAPLYRLMRALVSASAMLLLGWVFFDLSFSNVHLGGLLLSLFLSLLSFLSLGVLAGAATMFTRRGDPVAMAVSGLSTLASGVLYSPDVLPSWLAALGKALPLTHALSATRRAAVEGVGPSQLGGALGSLLLWFLLCSPLALMLFGLAFRRVRKDGSLSHY